MLSTCSVLGLVLNPSHAFFHLILMPCWYCAHFTGVEAEVREELTPHHTLVWSQAPQALLQTVTPPTCSPFFPLEPSALNCALSGR